MGGGGSKNNSSAMNGPIVGMRGKQGEPLNLGEVAVSVVRDWDKEYQCALDLIDSDEGAKGYVPFPHASVGRDPSPIHPLLLDSQGIQFNSFPTMLFVSKQGTTT